MSNTSCANPKCKKTYSIQDKNVDDGFCSYECWEEVNCLEPAKIEFEEIRMEA